MQAALGGRPIEDALASGRAQGVAALYQAAYARVRGLARRNALQTIGPQHADLIDSYILNVAWGHAGQQAGGRTG
jgi:hypothetical protein